MNACLLLLLSFLQIEHWDLGDEYYLLMQSNEQNITFSSFRISNPERIVIEVAATLPAPIALPPGATVSSVEIVEQPGKTRFIFKIVPGSSYNILNRKNTLLIGFKGDLFSADENIDTALARIETKRNKVIEKEALTVAVLPEKKEPLSQPKITKATPVQTENSEDALVAELIQEKEAKHKAEEAEKTRLAELEIKRKADEAENKRLAELEAKRKADEAEKIRLAELEVKRKAEETEKARLIALQEAARTADEAEKARLAELEAKRKAGEAEKTRLAELEAKRKAEETEKARLAELEAKRKADEAEKTRLAELEAKRKAEEAEKTRLAELEAKRKADEAAEKSVLASAEDPLAKLKVVKLQKTKKISEDAPLLPVVKAAEKGKLKNLYFRKFKEFSRVTMEVTGEIDYRFREIKGGYVIDIFNLVNIPKHLLNIIDTRAFNCEVKYIYPQKADAIFKIYIKNDEQIAVRKSEEGLYINFDFYKPMME